MGIRFDWKLLRGFRHSLPWGLSGGLDSFSVREAVAITGTPLVDVSSGVESRPGIKDVDKIATFCQAVSQRSEEHTSELQSLMRISYAVFCLKKKHYLEQRHRDTTSSEAQYERN